MTKASNSKTKSDKPFLAARIPHSLEKALESHVKITGESKTDSVIKALGSYLKWSEAEEKPNASDRLSKLEKKVAELESFLKTPQQTNLLDVKPVIEEAKQADNKEKNEIEKQTKTKENSVLLTHRKLADLTGINYNSVKSNPEGRIIEWEGRRFKTTKRDGRWKWEEITSQHQEA